MRGLFGSRPELSVRPFLSVPCPFPSGHCDIPSQAMTVRTSKLYVGAILRAYNPGISQHRSSGLAAPMTFMSCFLIPRSLASAHS